MYSVTLHGLSLRTVDLHNAQRGKWYKEREREREIERRIERDIERGGERGRSRQTERM